VSLRQHVLFLGFLILLAYAVTLTVAGPCVTSMEESFGLGHGAMGLLFAAGALGYLAGVRLAGRLARPMGTHWTLWWGVAGMGAGILLLAVSPIWPGCVAANGLAGVGGGLMEPALVAAVQTLYSEKRRAALNLTQVGFGLGAVLGPFLARQLLGAHAAWRWIFGIPGAATLGLLLLFPRQIIPSPASDDDSGVPARRFARHPALWLLFLALMFYVGGELGLTSWSSAYFETARGVSKSNASLAPLCLWAGILLGRAGMWFLSDRISSRLVLLICSAISVGFASAAFSAPTAGLSYGLLMVAGLGLGPTWPTILDHSARRLGTHSQRVLSWIIFGGGIGAFSQALLGPIAQAWSLRAAVGFAVALLAGVAACLLADQMVERSTSGRAGAR